MMEYHSSIVQEDMTCCYVCGRYGTEIHHIFFGNANRKLSTKYGLVIGLCYEHHRGKTGVHQNRELDLTMKRVGQREFNRHYPELDFLAVFGRNYL